MRTLEDLNGHIHDQINRLTNPDISDEDLKKEVARSNALSSLAQQSLGIANTFIKASQVFGDFNQETPKMLK